MIKTKFLGVIAIVAIAAVAGYNVYSSLNKNVELSDLALANVEALAANDEVFADSAGNSLNDCETYCMSSLDSMCIIIYTNNTSITCHDSRIRR